ncbi:MAG: hypothetical protein ABI783_00455 [Actinomycetota bacterium]
MLFVDDDQPKVVDGCEDRGARADDDASLPGNDPLPLVTSLRLGERRVENGNEPAEARTEPANRLRGQGYLRHEHNRTSPALERGRTCLEVDLGLTAPRRTVQEKMTSSSIEPSDDPCDGVPLGERQLVGLGLTRETVDEGRLSPLATARPREGRDKRQSAGGRRSVVVGKPERELHERRRNPFDDRACIGDLDTRWGLDTRVDHDSSNTTPTESDRYDRTTLDVFGDLIRERASERAGRDERVDLRERHQGERRRRPRRLAYAAAEALGFRKKK